MSRTLVETISLNEDPLVAALPPTHLSLDVFMFDRGVCLVTAARLLIDVMTRARPNGAAVWPKGLRQGAKVNATMLFIDDSTLHSGDSIVPV